MFKLNKIMLCCYTAKRDCLQNDLWYYSCIWYRKCNGKIKYLILFKTVENDSARVHDPFRIKVLQKNSLYRRYM